MKEKEALLEKKSQRLYDMLLKRIEEDKTEADHYFYSLIEKGKITSTEQLFDENRYDVLICLLGEAYAGKYLAWLKKLPDVPYSMGYFRRSVRSANPRLHIARALDDLGGFYAIATSGLTLETILEGGRTEEEEEQIKKITYSHLLSVEIDEGNSAVIQKINDIILSENNASGIVTYELLKGIVMSRSRELYELEGKLLVAARLQEGLRQSIVETMDSGTPEAFIYLFEVIRENDLQRYSSVKRAVGTWTGLYAEADADRINQKVIDQIHLILSDPAHAEACMQSDDAIEFYLALWVRGFYETDALYILAPGIIRGGIKHRIQVLFFYLKATQAKRLQQRMAVLALEMYPDDMSIVASFIHACLDGVYLNRYYISVEGELTDYYASADEAKKHYFLLKDMLGKMKEKESFSPFIFPWYSEEFTRQDIADKMAAIVYLTKDAGLLDDVCESYSLLSIYTRANLIRKLFNPPVSPTQMDTLLKALGDRAEAPRDNAFSVLDGLSLNEQQYARIEELLKYKAGDLRQNAIKLLLKQTPQQLTDTVGRLLADANADKRLGGLDLLLSIRGNKRYERTLHQSLDFVKQIKHPSQKEQVLIDQLTGVSSKIVLFSKDNGFGFYDPKETFTLPPLLPDRDFNLKKTFSLLGESSFFQKILGGNASKPYLIMEKLNELVDKHADYEYVTEYDDAALLQNIFTKIKGKDTAESVIDAYPLPDVWTAFYHSEIKDFKVMLQLVFILSTHWHKEKTPSVYEFMDREFLPDIVRFYDFNLQELKLKLAKLAHYDIVNRIVQVLARIYWEGDYYDMVSRNILASFLPQMNKRGAKKVYTFKSYGKEEDRTVFIYQHNCIYYWMAEPTGRKLSDEEFTGYFTIRYNYYSRAEFLDTDPMASFPKGNLSIFDFGKAYEMGLIPEPEIIKELMLRPNAPDSLSQASSYLYGRLPAWQQKRLMIFQKADFSKLKETLARVSARILNIELKRGDSTTEVSHLAMKLERVEGAAVLVAILKAIGQDSFGRMDYFYSSNYTKKEVLSKLLRCCYPAATDTAATLKEQLKGADISDKRLVEAGMYAPQWLEIIEEYLGWKGLFSAAYYFHAHINDWFDDRKKSIVARFTPIEIEDLRQGAFDIDWFHEAYKEIGGKRFEVVYDAAKYISSGAGHTRARKYADAVTGKLDAQEVKEEIEKKRNKDLLMAYCLIPLNKRSKKDLLERYLYLQQFLKESKTFGSQRQESEKKAVEIGMQNLARNAGYGDVTRLIWSVETELVKEIEPYLTPQEHQGVDLYIEINKEGNAQLNMMKGDKPLTSTPTRLRKYPYMEELKQVKRKLDDQHVRSKLMLEQAMEDETVFYIRELHELTANPIVWPLLKHLVFVTKEGVTGFYHGKSLVTPDGECLPQEMATEVRIAHPFDLYQQKVWAQYQKYLFDKGIRQPFKQVFRELYIKTEDEQPMEYSRRYAGNQIQPQKTVAVLKKRRWLANHEEGLQKIYYKENIIATIFALADWFSPSDIEPPTLEYVAFYDRKTYKRMPLGDVPDIIFSEVMRDVDLAVSVAHAGGVDPETSHSTIEMRRAIVEFTLPLFKLENVRLNGTHVFVEGSRGKYNIHLGSGVIHKEGKGAIAVLPVHSQHRGRLFLPFVDEDPKTAEILSKIILFAEDTKIKDPFILKQL